VYDLGGGTFDITIMAVEGGDLRVLTSNGDRMLGGVDFDEALAAYFAEKFEARFGVRPLDEPRSYQSFRDTAESAKINLSDTDEVPVSLTADGHVLDLDLRRSDFERLIRHYIEQTRLLTKQALADARLDEPGQIDNVLLVGGSTRIPAVWRMVRDLVGKEPETGINPDEVVAIGAAVYAANERGVAVRDTAGRELPPARVRNVTAHSLGVEVQNPDGTMRNERLIKKDSPIPASGSDIFSTVRDNQTSVNIRILQGEDDDPAECVKVGDGCVLDGIPPQPRGVPQIAVTLEYDKSGIVHVHARDNATGREVRAAIEYAALLTGEAIQQAIARIEQAKVK
jgi:molecular chaperone DnaK